MTDAVSGRPDLIACVLELDAIAHSAIGRTQGHRAHALFLALLAQADPVLATGLHADAKVKPFTVAAIDDKGRQLHPGSRYAIRVALLRGELFPPFARSFLSGMDQTLRLEHAEFKVRSVLATPGSHPWSGMTAWQALIDGASAARQCTLSFVTPTTFTAGTREDGTKQYCLFPEPGAVFRSLLMRWNALAPCPFPEDLLDRVHMTVLRHEVRTEMLKFSKALQVGFVGRCTYGLEGDPQLVRQVQTLVKAAFWLGAGYKTTQGMGLIRGESHG